MVKSILKGHIFELKIAKWLTRITNVPWYRVPMSGGAATSQKLEGWHGDVFTEAPAYSDLIIECKSYKKAVRISDINNPKSLLNSWIAQSKKEAGDKFWLLFFKTNHEPTFMIAPTLDILEYSNSSNLASIFRACDFVFKTKEYSLLQLKE